MRHERRMIDANTNRAAEGLRTLEDIARFALGDGLLASELKSARHALRSLAAGDGRAGDAITDRDTPGDVGTGIRTEAEGVRPDLAAVARAAGARTAEALRVLEEALKLAGAAELAPAAEALRYRVYEFERVLALRLGPASPQWRLCVLITGSLCARPWEDVAEAAIAGGADCLQLREKELESAELLRRGERLVTIARGRAHVVINDRADIAFLARADGVHVGQRDLTPEQARRVAGTGMLVGVSTSNLEQARAAVRAGASSCGLGPMFPSSTKPKDRLAGPAYARAYLADELTAGVPHLAISGVTAGNAGELAAIGVRGVAVSGAVCGADDPEGACRAILSALDESSSGTKHPLPDGGSSVEGSSGR